MGKSKRKIVAETIDYKISTDLKKYVLSWLDFPNKEYISVLKQVDTLLSVKFNQIDGIDDISRKSMVISDKTIFSENLHQQVTKRVELRTERHIDDLLYDDEPYVYYIETFLETIDIYSLEKWYENARSVLADQKILYVPKIVTIDHSIARESGKGEYDTNKLEVLLNPRTLFKAVPDGTISINQKELIPLFNLTLPCINGITIHNLNKLMDDNPEKLMRLRNYLLCRSLNIKEELGNENFSREVRKIELEIQDKVSESIDCYRSLGKTHLLQALGATIVPWIFTIYAFYTSADGVMKMIGPGGAIASISVALAEYLKSKYDIGREPIDFLVQLGKNQGMFF